MRNVAAVFLKTLGVPALLALVATTALAQEPVVASSTTTADRQASQPVSTGSLTVEQVPSGWIISPDVTMSQVNKKTATIVGVYGGWLTDRSWLVGAGGYWLANDSHDFGMEYGGLVLQYMVHSDRRIGFAVRGLVGGGDARIAARYQDVYGDPGPGDRPTDIAFGRSHHPGHGHGDRPPATITPDARLVFNEVFFVAEPQAQLMWNVSSRVRLTFGAGYRVIGGADPVNDRLRGPIGSVSIEFGGGH
jgi:hypothetical protein